jgi:hypothetical protein
MLVEERLADRARRMLPAQACHHRLEVRRGPQNVRTEAAHGALMKLEHGAVHLDRLQALAAQDEPRPPE